MPSTKDPNLVVNPGPGRLPEGSVVASSLTFVSGGGSDAGLTAHITDPVDAHMASAIGIPEYDPLTGRPLLSSVPEDPLIDEVFDGESVLDVLRMLKDLMPPRPNRVGWADTNTPNSGAPNWGVLEPYTSPGGVSTIGAWTDVSNIFRPSRAIHDGASPTFVLSGMVFPADKGVLAVYHNTDGTYGAGTTTLVGALYLGANPPPTGLAGANFIHATRHATQADYTATGVGVDKIDLTFRIAYKKDYTSWGVPYDNYTADFDAFQLATYTITLPIAAGDGGSYLIVHWREQYASSLAAITTFVEADLLNANCYSITPESVVVPLGETKWDTAWVKHVAKRNIYSPTGGGLIGPTATQSALAGTTTLISGVPHYTADFNSTLQFDVTNWFSGRSYNTGTVANPPDVPQDFLSIDAPLVISFSQFGAAATITKAYTNFKDGGGTLFNSTTNVPLPADTATCGPLAATPIPYAGGEYGVGPELFAFGAVNSPTSAAQVEFTMDGTLTTTPTQKVVFNSFPQTGGSTASTDTLEKFVDEKYRVDHMVAFTALDQMPPTGLLDYDSTVALAANAGPPTTAKTSSQVVGGRLVYPTFNFSTANYVPAGPNYNALFLADPINTQRIYARAFNTGIPRSTGRLRIKGLALAAFQATGAVVGSSGNFSDHAGKAVVALKVPGVTGFLDLGRVKGDPDLSTTTDWYGCRTGITAGGPEGDIYDYDMTAFTQDNGAGKFPLYVIVALVKQSPAGQPVSVGATEYLYVEEIEWLPPL